MKKTKTVLIGSAAVLAMSAQAALFTFDSPALNATIPDGNLLGYATTIDVSGIPDTILNVSVTLNISGGYIRDLYGYLYSPDSTLVVLLNQVGISESNPFGNTGSGINVTLDDSAPHTAISTVVTSPISGTYNTHQGGLGLLDFNGQSANGTWTLFLADLSSGGTAQLDSWSLSLDVVPEPTTWAAIIFGTLFAGTHVVRNLRRKTQANAQS
ncbi:MAG TPA: proprotein convertase P-domain-containing protein [Verrucomicrobiota bacterium]|nr:proprotein convertase P-domain-containing protein [Verrucomicrobiota bacterium]